MYGPPVRPPQPSTGLTAAFGGMIDWQTSAGDDKYRRALYTSWRRSNPYPSMATFDAPSREICAVRRIRTNTPLQALVTLNDSVYLEAARYFAYRMQEGGNNVTAQIQNGYERMFYKPIGNAKLQALEQLYATAYKTYQKDKDRQCEMIGVDNERNTPETAALVVVANAMLNLDETVMKN
jgi:hypothetical protein